jgi:hypothetical protein
MHVEYGCEVSKYYCLLFYETVRNEQPRKYYCEFRRDGNGLKYSYFSYASKIICTN